jgi:hypothetical protein
MKMEISNAWNVLMVTGSRMVHVGYAWKVTVQNATQKSAYSANMATI